MSSSDQFDVIVVGGGVAGLAAAASLAESGAKVMLIERKPHVGGRAYSYEHPALREVVDSQHVLLGCCTNLIDFCKRAGSEDKIRWYNEQIFLEPGGRSSTISLSGMPAPLHFAPSFLTASMLGWKDKAAIARGLAEFVRGFPEEDNESVESWLKRTRQTERAVRHFWNPIVMATLNDRVAECSTRYAGKVFHELFVKSSTGGRLGIPKVPLSEFYEDGARLVELHGGKLRLRTSVEAMKQLPGGGWSVRTAEGDYTAEAVVLALPFEQIGKLLPAIQIDPDGDSSGHLALANLRSQTERFTHSPFTSVLLWYDREITDLDHAWLLDTTIEWFFHKSRIRGYAPELGSYLEVVIAGSRAQLGMSREEILSSARRELETFFPKARGATLVKSGVLKEARATFSVTPGLDQFRPQQRTELSGLFLAGDWTATGWPSTMEGGVRSGRLAAGAIVGDPQRFMAAETPASGLMRWLARSEQVGAV